MKRRADEIVRWPAFLLGGAGLVLMGIAEWMTRGLDEATDVYGEDDE